MQNINFLINILRLIFTIYFDVASTLTWANIAQHNKINSVRFLICPSNGAQPVA